MEVFRSVLNEGIEPTNLIWSMCGKHHIVHRHPTATKYIFSMRKCRSAVFQSGFLPNPVAQLVAG
jgi:hypothetical protein